MATLYIDYENGNDNFSGTSFNPLASGTDGRITGYTFSSNTANFANDGTLAPIKNLFGVSETLEETNAWNGLDVTITRSTIMPPAGLYTTWNIFELANNATHRYVSTLTVYQLTIGTLYTASIYIKSNGRNQVTLQFTSDATKAARFDLSNGIVAQTGSNATAAISSVGDGWYRISVTATAGATNSQITLGLTNDTHNQVSTQTYVGDTNRGVYISSPQLEASSSVSSYEKPPDQRLTIWNGTSYLAYRIVQYINNTSLGINLILGGAAIGNQSVDRQYYIGGRWKNINTGATAARIFSGDEVRIMASPDPTLVGNATFTSSILRDTINISSSTNASPISVTTSANHEYSTGDTVIITGHTTNTNANGTWEITVTGLATFTLNNSTGNGVGGASGTTRLRNNTVIRLASAVTANIASTGNVGGGRTAWVQSSNVVTSLNTSDFQEGDCSDSIAIAAGFTTGKAAYKATGTLNLNQYQQISFYIKQTAGTATIDGDISLRLCSDTIGDTVVHTFNIPGVALINQWLPFTIDLKTNLNSAIQSIALYVDTDRGAQTFLLSNIIACKASSSNDSLTLQSLVGKNTNDENWWCGIQSINGTRLLLSNSTRVIPTSASNRGYFGISETTSLYKRETIKTPILTSDSQTAISWNRSGSLNNPIFIKCGYNRNDMTLQNSITFFDGLNSTGVGLVFARSFFDLSNLGVIRYNTGFTTNSSNTVVLSNIVAFNNSNNGINLSNTVNSTINNVLCSFNNIGILLLINKSSLLNSKGFSNSTNSISVSAISSMSLIQNYIGHNSGGSSVAVEGSFNIIKSSICNFNNRGFTVTNSANNNIFISCSTSGNVSSALGSAGGGINFFKNCMLSEVVEIGAIQNYFNSRSIIINKNNTTNNYIHYTDGGTIYNSASIRYSNTGFSWVLAPTSTIRNYLYPLDFPIAKVAVNANNLVTVRAWMRRTSTFLTTGLRIKADQIAGVNNDITSYMTAAADTWEQVTLNFTPTEAGVVEILAECFGGSTFTAYVDDISVTQV